MDIQLGKNYTKQGLFHSISIYNSPDDYNIKYVLKSIRFMFQFGHKEPRITPTKIKLLYFTEVLFDKYKHSYSNISTLADIVDIIVEHSTKGNEYLEKLREIERINEIRYIQQLNVQHIQTRLQQLPIRINPNIGVGNNVNFATERNLNNPILQVVYKAPQIPQVLQPLQPLQPPQPPQPDLNIIYGDSQNIHTKTINNSVKLNVKLLIEKYGNSGITIEYISKIISDKYGENTIITEVITRIKEDIANFNIDITLAEVFVAIWVFIHTQKDDIMNELEIILLQEMVDMHGQCATGHLSRLLNVIQGFSDDFNIRISIKEQCNAVVRTYLNKKLQESNNEEIHDGLISKSSIFLKFIDDCIEEKIQEWTTVYGLEFIENLTEVKNTYIL
jgi:hypothetical protein